MHCVVPQIEKKLNCLETGKPNISEMCLLHEQDQNDHVFVFVFYPLQYLWIWTQIQLVQLKVALAVSQNIEH